MNPKVGPRHGTNVRKEDASRCMVVGCDRTGLYRTSTGAKRGYCSVHKGFALERWSEATLEKQVTHLLARAMVRE